MRSSFFGINTLLRALQAQQTALDTANHNIANAGVDGYSRQRVKLATATPYTLSGARPNGGSLYIGAGSVVTEIRRERDLFLDLELRRQTQEQSRWDAKFAGLAQVEAIFNEPGDSGIQTLVSSFFSAWGDLSNNPQSAAARSAVRSTGDQLALALNDTARRLVASRRDVSGQIALAVPEVNDLAVQLASLNAQVAPAAAQGDAPNDMLDERDRLLDRLVTLTGASYRQEGDGTTTVMLGGRTLVAGDRANRLAVQAKNLADGTQVHEVKWADDFKPAEIGGGEIGGMIELRDEIVPEQLRKLDLLASTIAANVNQVHRGGFGIGDYANKVSNFFEPMLGAKLSETGLGHDLVAGTITVGNTTLNVDPLNQSITDVMSQVVAAINAQPGVTAAATWSLNPQTGRASITYGTAAAGTTVPLGGAADTSNLLELLGLVGASAVNTGVDGLGNFIQQATGTGPVALVSAASIALDAAIKGDVNAIAAAAGQSAGLTTSNGPGDNTNALALAALRDGTFAALSSLSFGDYYAGAAADLGALTREAEQSASNQGLLVEHLQARRESLSGVSLDEEATRLIEYQRAYQAAARGITTLDEMLDTIISRMGRVGL